MEQLRTGALFVTGTGTDVGKTYVTALLLKKLRELGHSPAYYKAAMSGNQRRPDGSLIPGDARFVQKVSGIPQPLEEMCPYVYEAAVSPHLAAHLEGNPVELDRVVEGFHSLCQHYDFVTMEGSGGILCPLRFPDAPLWLPDVVKACALGCLLVADAGLGTINQVALTAFYLQAQGIPLKGVILNRYDPDSVLHRDNLLMCQHLTDNRVVACVREGEDTLSIDPESLLALYH